MSLSKKINIGFCTPGKYLSFNIIKLPNNNEFDIIKSVVRIINKKISIINYS